MALIDFVTVARGSQSSLGFVTYPYRCEWLPTLPFMKVPSAGNFSCGSNPCFIRYLRRDDDEIIVGVGDIVDDDIMLRRVIWTY